MRDSSGRVIDYMRVSITDRCNLRCGYCIPNDLPLISHDEILRYEEILRVCRVVAGLGIKAIRVTGGEPLTRKGCLSFIRQLKALPGIEYVTMTTNAVLLEPYIDELRDMGLDGLNISINSLDPDTYRQITKQDALPAALGSLHKAIDAGIRVKVNCVPIRGINEKDILSVVRLAESLPVDVRFIELMPTDVSSAYEGIPGGEVLSAIRGEYPDLRDDPTKRGYGPAHYYTSGRLKGSIGIIDALSNHFCARCNRLRLTGTGFLKLCLHHGDGLDLREMLRSGSGDGDIKAAIEKAVMNKPERHTFIEDKDGINKMSRIGG